MLQTLRLLRDDFHAKALWCHGRAGTREVLKAVVADGSASMVVYRCMQAARRHRRPLVEMLFNKINSAVLGCVIGRGAELGPGFVLIHSNGVVINGEVRGGRGVHLEHQVTIGAERRRSPRLGNSVFVGAGAKIIGPVTLGDRCRIGANAVVVEDVAPDTTVVGIPARPVRRRPPSEAHGAEGPAVSLP